MRKKLDKNKKNKKEKQKNTPLTIWATDQTKCIFRKEWEKFNQTITGTVTQEEYLKLMIETHKDKFGY